MPSKDPILRLLNLQPYICSASAVVGKNIFHIFFVFKMHQATTGVVIFLQRWPCNSQSLDWLQVCTV
jgi:hypothetical protein